MAEEPFKSNPNPIIPGGKRNLLWILVAVLLVIFILPTFFSNDQDNIISWKRFSLEILPTGDVDSIIVVNHEVAHIYLKPKLHELDGDNTQSDGKSIGFFKSKEPQFKLVISSPEKFEEKLALAQADVSEDQKVTLIWRADDGEGFFGGIFIWILPLLLFGAVWFFAMRKMSGGEMGGGSSSAFKFGKSKGTFYDAQKGTKVSFKDVAGLEEAKEEVMEIVEFLKSPEQYTKLGAKIPRGVMLVGPPGTGKTLMAKAVAGEAAVPFISLSGSDFVEMFVGVGASRVRDLFNRAKEKAPCIVFIDEIDGLGRARGKNQAFGGNEERESTLNQLLTEMDGFEGNSGVIVLAATNRADILDPALLRPGRFDRHIHLDLPNQTERKAIFEVHVRDKKLGETINLDQFASQTPGFSGADIANICNEAALIAARKKKEAIDQQDFMDAIDRIIGGLEKRSKIISPEEKKTIAYHEAGHALVSWELKNVASLLKVSIIPRGRSLGAAWYIPQERQLTTADQFKDQITATLAGRAAEEVIFGEISSGALDDLEKVNKQAYSMIAMYGLGEKLKNISYYDSSGRNESGFTKPYSEETAALIDKEVRKIVDECYADAKSILTAKKEYLDRVAHRLMEKETIFREDMEEILGKRGSKQV